MNNMNNKNNISTDYGTHPFTIDLNRITVGNDTYRTALWTGENLQLTLMSIPVGSDIGLEVHQNTDQLLRVEQGSGVVQMGSAHNNLYFQQIVFEDDAIFVPAGTWHNVTNIGNVPMKLYSVYAPPHHPFGTVQQTKADTIN
ncbi:MAG: cupin domain-containing protein [Clostridiales bacterium]|jgi:mannose-6-phosphate isomerase-like protein (cupin superfamily)|nr:cupin domain-containing protein [Clostridiales bacterium]